MKHILNNISRQEKNSILEQYSGGKRLQIENFSKLVNSKLGDVKTLISEEESMMDGNQNWLKVLSGLRTFNNPKVINFKYEGKPITSLNWGTHSEAGKDKNWGLSIASDGDISFTTKDEIQSKLFEDAMGVENYYNKLNGSYSYMEEIDYSNPQDLVTKIKSIIKVLG